MVKTIDILDEIPSAEWDDIKPGFEERYKELLGDRYDEFLKYSFSYINKSIRVNTLKIKVDDLKKRLEDKWDLYPIPWCKEGFWIVDKEKDRYDIGNLAEHQLGYVYVQEAASMIPPQVLDPQPGEKVLDMCAAPGSKTTEIASMMENQGVLVANDLSGGRLKSLGINLQRCGVRNTVMTKMKGFNFKRKEDLYDRVLVDAPCSGTGTIRTSLKTLRMWSPGFIKRMSHTQRGLIRTGFEVLAEGGTMVYSTCSLEPQENEGVVSWLLEKYDNAELVEIYLPINRSEPVTKFKDKEYNPEVKKCLRIYPQDNNTEGFFVAKIRKKSE